MAEYIELEALREKRSLVRCVNGIETRLAQAVLWDDLCAAAKADVAPIPAELRDATAKLVENYEKALGLRYVQDPVTWALARTLRAMEGSEKCEKSEG